MKAAWRIIERWVAILATCVAIFLYGGMLYGYVFDYEATVARGRATQMRLKAWSDGNYRGLPESANGYMVPEWLFWTGLFGAPLLTAGVLWRYGR